jgi:hypothetical protein
MNTISAHYSYRLAFNEEEGEYEFLPTEIFGTSTYLDSIFSKQIKGYVNRWSNDKRKQSLKFVDPRKKGGNINIVFESYSVLTLTGMIEVPDDVNDCIFTYHTGSDKFHFVVYKDAKEQKEMLFNRWEDDFAYDISDYITMQLNK